MSALISPQELMTREIVFEQPDFLVLKTRGSAKEIITLRHWEPIDDEEAEPGDPLINQEILDARVESWEFFGLQKQVVVDRFAEGTRRATLIRSTWPTGDQFEIEITVPRAGGNLSMVWAYQDEATARKAVKRIFEFSRKIGGARMPAGKTEGGLCLFCDQTLMEGPVRQAFANVQKVLKAECVRSKPQARTLKNTVASRGKEALGCLKGLGSGITGMISMLYEISNFIFKMRVNTAYQQKVADGVGSAISAFIWHPIDSFTRMYNTIGAILAKEAANLNQCGGEYQAKAICALWVELVSGRYLFSAVKRIFGTGRAIAEAPKSRGIVPRVPTVPRPRAVPAPVRRTMTEAARTSRTARSTELITGREIAPRSTRAVPRETQISQLAKERAAARKAEQEAQRAREAAAVERAAERESQLAAAREKVITENLEYTPTTTLENTRFIGKALMSKVSKNRLFFDVENAFMKPLNDLTRDKNLVTALTNLHKKILGEEVKTLLAKNPGLKITAYSDFKSMRFAIEGKLPSDIKEQLQQVMKNAGERFGKEAADYDVIADARPADWFRGAVASRADDGNLGTRIARDREHGSNFADFDAPEVQQRLSNRFTAATEQRTKLESRPRISDLMEGRAGRRIPSQETFDLIRKNPDPETLAKALRERFGKSDIDKEDADALLRYARSVDEFSPSLNVPERTIVNLDGAEMGGYSADFLGLGSANAKATAEAILNAKSVSEITALTRKAEQEVTKTFQRRLQRFQQLSGDIAKCSGDDCIGVAKRALTEKDKQTLLNRMSADPLTREIRMSFVQNGVRRAADRTIIATQGESIEKALRKSLEGIIPRDRLQAMTFGVDMQTTMANQGQVRVLSAIRGQAVTASEAEQIRQATARAVAKHNESMIENGVPSNYTTVGSSAAVSAPRIRNVPVMLVIPQKSYQETEQERPPESSP